MTAPEVIIKATVTMDLHLSFYNSRRQLLVSVMSSTTFKFGASPHLSDPPPVLSESACKYGYSRDFTAGRRKPVKPASRDQGLGGARWQLRRLQQQPADAEGSRPGADGCPAGSGSAHISTQLPLAQFHLIF